MNSLIALALMSQMAIGEPVVPVEDGRPAMFLSAGEPIPFDGICLDPARAMTVAKRITDAETQVALYETKFIVTKPVMVGGLVAIIVASLAIGAGVAYAAKK